MHGVDVRRHRKVRDLTAVHVVLARETVHARLLDLHRHFQRVALRAVVIVGLWKEDGTVLKDHCRGMQVLLLGEEVEDSSLFSVLLFDRLLVDQCDVGKRNLSRAVNLQREITLRQSEAAKGIHYLNTARAAVLHLHRRGEAVARDYDSITVNEGRRNSGILRKCGKRDHAVGAVCGNFYVVDEFTVRSICNVVDIFKKSRSLFILSVACRTRNEIFRAENNVLLGNLRIHYEFYAGNAERIIVRPRLHHVKFKLIVALVEHDVKHTVTVAVVRCNGKIFRGERFAIKNSTAVTATVHLKIHLGRSQTVICQAHENAVHTRLRVRDGEGDAIVRIKSVHHVGRIGACRRVGGDLGRRAVLFHIGVVDHDTAGRNNLTERSGFSVYRYRIRIARTVHVKEVIRDLVKRGRNAVLRVLSAEGIALGSHIIRFYRTVLFNRKESGIDKLQLFQYRQCEIIITVPDGREGKADFFVGLIVVFARRITRHTCFVNTDRPCRRKRRLKAVCRLLDRDASCRHGCAAIRQDRAVVLGNRHHRTEGNRVARVFEGGDLRAIRFPERTDTRTVLYACLQSSVSHCRLCRFFRIQGESRRCRKRKRQYKQANKNPDFFHFVLLIHKIIKTIIKK